MSHNLPFPIIDLLHYLHSRLNNLTVYDNVADYVAEDAKATILKCFFRMCTDTRPQKFIFQPNDEDGSAEDQGPSLVHVVPQP
jgi:hypothetical protein